ncbi:MAG: hypothetical protein JRN52_10105 [Nitrososphaerota archaeon]|nr:hypothetical protein [Nitrososphaerota archaeon]
MILFRAIDSLFGQSGPDYLSTILYLLSALALFLILALSSTTPQREPRKVVKAEMERIRKDENEFGTSEKIANSVNDKKYYRKKPCN